MLVTTQFKIFCLQKDENIQNDNFTRVFEWVSNLDHEDGGDMFLQKVGSHLQDYTKSQPTRS
jgi:hypothetical protein